MLELIGKTRKSNVVADIVRDRNALVIIEGEENIVLPSGTHMYRIPSVNNKYNVLWEFLNDGVRKNNKNFELVKYVVVYTNREENLDVYKKWLESFEGCFPDKIYILAHKGLKLKFKDYVDDSLKFNEMVQRYITDKDEEEIEKPEKELEEKELNDMDEIDRLLKFDEDDY